jgi:hypothetical protein
MDDEIKEMNPKGKHPDPAGGVYEIKKEVKDRAIWADRRETFGDKGTYWWGLAFEFMEHPMRENHTEHGCLLHSMSRIVNETRGQDAGSDFCNLYNVFKGSGKKFDEIHANDCKEMPPKEKWGELCTKVMENELGMTPEQVAQFVAGIIDGLIGKNDLPEIQKCMKDSAGLDQDIEEAIQDFQKGDVPDIIKGVQAVGKIIQELPNDLQDCGDIQDDVNRIEKWAQIFTHPEQLIQTLVANAITNHSAVIADAQKIVSDFNANNFVQAGEDIGDILVLLIGPVPKTVFIQ